VSQYLGDRMFGVLSKEDMVSQHDTGCCLVAQDATGKECGLHSGNVVESAAEQAKDDLRDLFQDNSVEAVSKQQLQEMMDGKRDKDTLVVLYAPWCQYSQVSGTLQAPDVCSRCMRCAAQCCQTMHCFNRQRCCICSLATVHQCIP